MLQEESKAKIIGLIDSQIEHVRAKLAELERAKRLVQADVPAVKLATEDDKINVYLPRHFQDVFIGSIRDQNQQIEAEGQLVDTRV